LNAAGIAKLQGTEVDGIPNAVLCGNPATGKTTIRKKEAPEGGVHGLKENSKRKQQII